MVLGISEIMLSDLPAAHSNRATVLQSLENEYAWEGFGEQGLRIKAVEDACKDDFALMDHWFEYLENNVTLPVQAKYIGDSSALLHYGAIVEVNGFADAADDYGVIGSLKYGTRRIQVPLCDVELLEITPPIQALHDYIVWFVNR